MIPNTPLELTLPAIDDLTLDEAEIFESGRLTVAGFKAFMEKYSNWKAKDVGGLTIKERRGVVERIIADLNDRSVSKGNGASS